MEKCNSERFIEYLKSGDKDSCLMCTVGCLHQGMLDIRTLYEDILGPALNQLHGCHMENENCIWREHISTSIIRTIIECCYPFVRQAGREKQKKNIKVLVFCPENELHELGARMVTDFFTLYGYDAIFIGANTPSAQIKAAVAYEKPKYVAISVTDYYNLVSAKKAIELVRSSAENIVFIIVGGNAFRDNRDRVKEIGADVYMERFEDIKRLGEEDSGNETGL
ncbi:MAG TPA: cobalamin B12-binding domain-containing protein [Negativicutes bacterium]|nr:cobalamin B12-binding domain-containing protein [Negativicutes bacterium]